MYSFRCAEVRIGPAIQTNSRISLRNENFQNITFSIKLFDMFFKRHFMLLFGAVSANGPVYVSMNVNNIIRELQRVLMLFVGCNR